MADSGITRRGFLKGSALVGAAALTGRGDKMAEAQSAGTQNSQGEIPRRPLGKTGVQVSAIGLGGYHLGSAKRFAGRQQHRCASHRCGHQLFR